MLIASHQQHSVVVRSLLTVLKEDPALALEQEYVVQFNERVPHDGSGFGSTDDVIKGLQLHCVSSLHKAVNVAETQLMKDVSALASEKMVAEAYLQLGQYCRTLLEDAHTTQRDLVTSILRAMKHSSTDARQLFPCLLHIPTLSTDTQLGYLFAQECKGVPDWMFLGWVSQILACLDSHLVVVLDALIVRLATSYPNAVKYPFRLSLEKYTFPDSAIGARSKGVVYSLKCLLLKNEPAETLLRAFSCLSQPHMILNYHLDRLRTMLDDTAPDFGSIAKHYREMVSEAFPDTSGAEPIHGRIFDGVHKYKDDLERVFGTEGNEVEKKGSAADALRSLDAIIRALNLEKFPLKSWAVLKDYSPYLSRYQPIKFESDIEIPGQYDWESRPLPQHHIMIAAFSRNVIPLSSRLGLIQWVDETLSLKELIQNALTDTERKDYMEVHNLYAKWTDIKGPNKKLLYEGVYLKYSRDEAIAAYKEKVNMLPWDILRRAVMSLSPSHEAFFRMRHSLAVSHATMCVAHWLLGIGDRNLSNCLVNRRCGTVLGIDFGHAFGMATHVLGVPELMPFRLTPHIVDLMQPMQEHGLLRETMCHCMRALRSEAASSLLLATMQVFVQEPSMDWLQLARKRKNLPTMEKANDDPGWFPRVKITSAKRKLMGQNPAYMTCDELRLGYSGSFLEKCLKVAHRDPQHNIRARLPRDQLSPHE